MRRPTILLICASAVALFAGLAPLASRWYHEHANRTRAEVQQTEIQRQAQAQIAELQARRPEILDEMTRLQLAGEHGKVLALASRFRLVDDAAVRSIHARSAQELSLRQTLDRMAVLAAEYCTEPSARRMVESLFAKAYPDAGTQPAQDWVLQRMTLSEFKEAVRSRVREWGNSKPTESSHSHDHGPKASVLEALRGEHTPRASPAVVFSIMQGLRMDELTCVWRVKGTAALGKDGVGLPKPFVMVLWMAPSATERGMERDVLSVQGLD